MLALVKNIENVKKLKKITSNDYEGFLYSNDFFIVEEMLEYLGKYIDVMILEQFDYDFEVYEQVDDPNHWQWPKELLIFNNDTNRNGANT